jgi:hypothetical protein
MIILAYDSDTITYLEGNGDGNGLIRVAIRDWSDFNLRQLSGRGRYIAHLVQPTEEFYQAEYPSCPHEVYEGNGVCTTCGTVYDWESTLDPWAKGIYRLTEKVTPRVEAPYHASAAAELTLEKNQQIQTTGQSGHILCCFGVCGAHCFIHCSNDHILQHIHIIRIHSLFFDRKIQQLMLTVDRSTDHTATGGRRPSLALHFFLHTQHLLLHLLCLLHHCSLIHATGHAAEIVLRHGYILLIL